MSRGHAQLVSDLLYGSIVDLRRDVLLTDAEADNLQVQLDELRSRPNTQTNRTAIRLVQRRLDPHLYRERRRAMAVEFFTQPKQCQPWLDFFGWDQSRIAARLGLE